VDSSDTVAAVAPAAGDERAASPKIDVRDIHFAVEDREILRGITVAVRPGEILCVMGLSGSGKSTLTRCIAGLVRPTQGEILIDGEDIVPMTEDELLRVRAKIGVVFQYSALFDSMSVYENIAFGILRGPRREQNRKLSRTQVLRMVAEQLHAVGLPGIERRMPAELSGGMRRRVGLARALATQPDIVLYDEPTSGLDPVTAAAIDDLILSTRGERNVTSIVVSHDMGSIYRIANRVLMIYEGAVQAYGTPEEIRETNDPIVRQFITGSVEGPINPRRR
jgi:phospholipid/cholesterol/gamma-HCH transport system ATP-binding protein